VRVAGRRAVGRTVLGRGERVRRMEWVRARRVNREGQAGGAGRMAGFGVGARGWIVWKRRVAERLDGVTVMRVREAMVVQLGRRKRGRRKACWWEVEERESVVADQRRVVANGNPKFIKRACDHTEPYKPGTFSNSI